MNANSPAIPRAPLTRLPRRLRAVAAFDVVESTRLMEEDEEGTVERWRALVARATAVEIPEQDGRMVKSLGDGMLVEFETASGAVRAALAIVEAARRQEEAVDPGRRLRLRVSINLCEVQVDEHDIYGDGVNVAARLMSLAGPDEIVVTATMRDQLGQSVEADLEDLGVRLLRNMRKPVRVFRVFRRGAARTVPRVRTSTRPRPLSIAVMPFRNLTVDEERAAFLEGLAEEIVTGLSRLPDLFVISRLSTLAFRDSVIDVANLAEALGVRYVLSGSLRAAGGRIRLNVELADGESGEARWRDKFDAEEGGLFDLQDRITAALVGRIAPYMREAELSRARTKRPESMDAHELVIRAIDRLHRFAEEDFEAARGLLEQAIALDPRYAAPHAWLARWHLLRIGQGLSSSPDDDHREARRRAELALERDGTDHVALAVSAHIRSYLERDFDGAMREFERALAFNPNSTLAWALSGACCAYRGEGPAAIERASRAIELSPYDPLTFYHTCILSLAYMADEQYERAIEWAHRSLRENRCFTATHRFLVISLVLAGRVEEARPALRELLELEPGLTVERFQARFPARDSNLLADALRTAGLG